MIKFALKAFYDSDTSQTFFDDFKNGADGAIVDLYGLASINYCVIFQNDDLAKAKFFKKSKLVRMQKADLIDLACNLDVDLDFDNCTKSDLIEALLQIDNRSYYQKHHNQSNRFSDLEYDFVIRGYSQGDCVKVVVIGSDDFKHIYTPNYLSNLFYNTLFNCWLEILESTGENVEFLDDLQWETVEEIYLEEYVQDVYTYNKDEILEIAKNKIDPKYRDRAVEFLEKHLGDDLPYV